MDLERPGALGVGRDPGARSGRARRGSCAIRTGGAGGAVGVDQHHLGAELVVALAEHRRGDRERLADGRLRGLPTEVDEGHDVHDRDASDHAANLPKGCTLRAIAGPTQAELRATPGPVRRRAGQADRPPTGWTTFPSQLDRSIWRYRLAGACDPTIHRPSRPARRPGRPRRARRQPAVVLAPADPGRLRGRRPRRCGSRPATTRCGCSARSRRAGSTSWRPTTASSTGSARGAGRPRRLPHRRPLVPAARAATTRRARSRYFSPEFGITAVLPQYSGGLGILAGDHLKAASDLGVPLVGVGLLYRHGYFKQSLSREGWQQETYPVLDPDELPLSLLREADGSRGHDHGSRMPGGAELRGPDLGRPGRPGAAAAARLRRRGEPRPPPRGHRPAVRRQQRAPAAPGAAARRRRRPGAARVLADHRRARARGVPHQRGPRRLPRPRADPRAHVAEDGPGLDFDTALEVGRALAPSSPPTPRCRPASTGSPATWSSSTSAAPAPAPGVPVDRILALGAEDYEGGDPGVFNMAVMGFRLAQRANGVSQLHGHVSRGCSTASGRRSTRPRCRSPRSPTACTRPTWVGREVFELAAEHGADPDADDADAFWAVGRQGPGQRHLGDQAGAARAAGRGRPAPAARSRGPSAARRRPSSAGSTPRSTPTCSPSASPAACRRTSGSR